MEQKLIDSITDLLKEIENEITSVDPRIKLYGPKAMLSELKEAKAAAQKARTLALKREDLAAVRGWWATAAFLHKQAKAHIKHWQRLRRKIEANAVEEGSPSGS